MERTIKGRALRLEVSETDKRVWFRLYSHDAAEVRGEIDPGTIVYIRARVSEYLRKGGFLVELEPEDPRPSVIGVGPADGATHVIRQLEDKFSLEVPTLELFYLRESELPFDALLIMTPPERLRSVALFGTVAMALDRIRAGLDSKDGRIEPYHEAEEILCELLGNPVWTRPE